LRRKFSEPAWNGLEIAHSSRKPIDGTLVLELWSQTAVNGKRIRRTQVDDSLIAIVVVVMVALEFIQFAISPKTGEDRVTRGDASDKERVLESAFRDLKVDCSFSQVRNEE
jgi:hypothetical protein